MDWERPDRKQRSPAAPLIAAFAVPVITLLLLVHRLALALDHVLFPGFRSVEVKQPLFVVGLPRSGTTFAHRLLATHQSAYTTMPLWELVLAPALCQKYLLRGLRRFDAAIGRPLHRTVDWLQRRLAGGFSDVHPTDLTDPEEDYLGLLPYDGCFLRVLLFPYAKSTWDLGRFSALPESRQKRLLAAYRGIIQRHLAFRGRELRLLSKNPSFTNWVPALSNAFPDAVFVGLHRDLEQVVPSQLSSISGGLAMFGNSVQDPWLVRQFVSLLQQYRTELDEDAELLGHRMRLVDYRSITTHPADTIDHLYAWLNLPERTESDMAQLTALLSESRTYRSRHSYSLEDFGLSAAELRALEPEPVADATQIRRRASPEGCLEAPTEQGASHDEGDTAVAKMTDAK